MSMADGGYSSSAATGVFGEDEKGKFQYYDIAYEEHCDCHPETCCHREGRVIVRRRIKQYVH